MLLRRSLLGKPGRVGMDGWMVDLFVVLYGTYARHICRCVEFFFVPLLHKLGVQENTIHCAGGGGSMARDGSIYVLVYE